MMIFIDGENLVCRYQAMVSAGHIPRPEGLTHVNDVLVWQPEFASLAYHDEVMRATYYTYVVGDETVVEQTRRQIKNLRFAMRRDYILPTNLTPKVFKKPRAQSRAKGVDITLTVDVLSNIYQGNVDTVLLLSGDGDYVPVAQEVQRCGKLCCVSAFSSGLSPELELLADQFYCLDNTTFQSS